MNENLLKKSTKAINQTRIIGAIAALVAIVIAFLFYINQTHKFVIEQNEQYSETTATQMARRINEMFTDSQTCLKMASATFSNTLTSPELKTDNLRNLSSNTMFENVLYASADGKVLTENGNVSSNIVRDYIDRGLRGESGISVILNSELFDEDNVVVMYEPLRYKHNIIGVIAGVFTESFLAEEISMSVLGSPAISFLCKRDGQVVATSDMRYNGVESVFDLGPDSIGESNQRQSTSNLQDIFADGSASSFVYETKNGTGCAYAKKLESYNLMILSAFPIAVTNNMSNTSNIQGISLLGTVVVIFIIYITVLILQGRKQRKELAGENRHFSNIVVASTELFKRFAMFDFDKLTYKYYKSDGVNGAIPESGPYRTFADYWLSTIRDPEELEIMTEALDENKLRKALSSDAPFLRYEFRSYTDQGMAWLQISIIGMKKDEYGNVVQALYAVQDVTGIKEREQIQREALEEAYHAAEHASKAKSNFLSSMSHDIRTPMNTIMGLTALASMNLDDPARVRDSLSKINIANRHLLGLINEVLDMAKIESGNISLNEKSFDLSDVIDETMTIVRSQMDAKNQTFNVNLANIDHERVYGDPMRLKQVFLNLLGNAVKFTPEGGTITFSMDELPSNLPGFGCYRFTFSDTGCGISDDFKAHLFEPFSRQEDLRISKIEGTGLGLPIVKSIVEMMNGTIEVQSVIDKGTTFVVVVYMKTLESDDEDILPLEGQDVLICDDDEIAGENACIMLKSIGMRPTFVTSAEKAVELVKQRAESGRNFSVIIVDWKMPGMSGLELAREIHQITSDEMPIVLVSAYDWSDVENEARDAGISIFVSKPLFKSRLVNAMQKALIGDSYEKSAEVDKFNKLDLSGKRVLLTDDNMLAAEVVTDLLSTTNAEIVHASNGKEAYDLLLDSEPGYFDLVLMDVQMPIMNGHEASRAIRNAAETENRPDLADIPIIALTADAFSDDVEKAKSAGMNAHLSKPIDLNALAKTLVEWI